MSKILANEIANYGDNAPIDLKEGLNIPAGKPLQAAGAVGTSGQVLSSTGTTIEWVTPFDGDYNSLSNLPTIPAAQVPSDWNATSGVSRILNKPVVPPLPSITTAAAGTAALAYNSGSGEFTFTPPDLSSYATEAWVNGRGYLTSYTETDTLSSVVARGNNTGGDIVVSDNLYIGGTGSTSSHRLWISSNDILIQNSQTGGRNISSAQSGFRVTGGLYGNTLLDVGGSVSLYKDSGLSGSDLRLQTTGTGVTISGALELGSGDLTTTGKLYYSNNFADLTALNAVNAGTYHGMFAHVHAEGHGYFAHAGGWIQMLDTGSSLGELADVNLATAPQTGQVLKYDGSNWVAAADGTGGGGIALTDLSVATASAGTAALSYNNVSGVFTYTPPDLSGYLTSYTETDPVFSASAAANVTTSKITNWDTAFGWGNHASAGYLTSYTETDTLATITTRGDSTTNAITVGGLTVDSAGNTVGKLAITDEGSYSQITFFNSNGDPKVALKGVSDNLYIEGGAGDIRLHTYALFNVNGNVTLNNGGNGNTTIGGTLTAGGLTYPTTNGTNGQVLTSDGAGNVTWSTVSGGGGNTSVTISDTAPGGASAGDLWWESDTGRLKIYYQDTDTIQWVDTNPALRQDRIASTGAPATASSTGTPGDIRYDSSYVYICIANNTWKRAALATW